MISSFLFHICDNRKELLQGIPSFRNFNLFFLYCDRFFVILSIIYLIFRLYLLEKISVTIIPVLSIGLICWLISEYDMVLIYLIDLFNHQDLF